MTTSTMTLTSTAVRSTVKTNKNVQHKANSKLRPVTYAELQQNAGGDKLGARSWTAVNGIVYDITDFCAKHPGGSIIRFAAGRDATCLYESYHPSTSVARTEAALQNKCETIGQLIDGPVGTTTSKYTPDSTFFRTVQQRVDAFIQSKGWKRDAYDTVYAVEIFITAFLYVTFSFLTSFYNSWLACTALGIVTGRMGFLMHSGNHGASSRRSHAMNRFSGYFMDLIGSSNVIWGYEHQVAHHQDPNELHRDNDCEIGNPIVRMHPGLDVHWTQRYQHILVPVGMTIGLLKWYINDFKHYWKGTVGNVAMTITRADWTYLLLFKGIWFLIHFLIPAYYFGPLVASAQCLFFMAVGGHYIENIFIVNHIQEDHVAESSVHWANKQVIATSNWGSESQLMNFMSGGLNHQVEHHLFPSLNVYFYPHIAHIVRSTCEEFNLPYGNYKSFWSAWYAMWSYLRDLGNPSYTYTPKKAQ